MALESIGFALGVIPELRHQITTLKKRFENFAKGPKLFQDLKMQLTMMDADTSTVESILRECPNTIPTKMAAMFHARLTSVKHCLILTDDILNLFAQRGFTGSSSGKRAALFQVFRRAARANSYADQMATLETQVKEASNTLQSLVSDLTLCVKMDTLQLSTSAANTEARYTRECSAPGLLSKVTLDFDTTDAHGEPVTPEGKLKRSVLFGTNVTAAAGVMSDAYGVVGMAGVGKTIAMQGLAHDKDIRNRFVDGVHYMSLGEGATMRSAMDEIARIMKITGASDTDSTVEKYSSLREAVDCAVKWFKDRICLYLVDDVWPTESCRTGYLSELRQILRSCQQSRMAITTRSVAIAQSAGRIVDFGARDPQGAVSRKLFMTYATSSAPQESPGGQVPQLRCSISTILSLCAGLPIALSIAGSAVALLVRLHGDFEGACDAYAGELESANRCLADEMCSEGSSLSACIQLSLKYLEDEFLKWKCGNASSVHHSIIDLYISLCVLENQAWVPISVLSRMWQVDEKCVWNVVNMLCGMSLAKINFRKDRSGSTGEAGLMIHDLHLVFCQREARKQKVQSQWHYRLLEGYLQRDQNTSQFSTQPEGGLLNAQALTTQSCRSWWSEEVPKDAYIHENLARHLSLSGLVWELASLLLDGRWTKLRMEIGGILALKTDIEWLEKTDAVISAQVEIRDSFKLIFDAIRVSWGRVFDGHRAFLFQICGRLISVRRENEIVAAYVKSLEEHTGSPYLLPVNSFFPNVHSALLLEIHMGGRCWSVAYSPCGRYIAAGGGRDVVVLQATTGTILKRMTGHTDTVTVIAFAGPKKLISGSWDKTLCVWEWETSNKSVQTLVGHTDVVRCVAVRSDTKWIFSGSLDGTLRIWDATNGTQIREFVQCGSIFSLAVHGDNRTVAFGLYSRENKNAVMKVVDSCTGATIFENTTVFEERVLSLAFSPNNGCLASGSWDKKVRLWDTKTWKRIGEPLEGHLKGVFSVGFSPNGEKIVSGSFDSTFRVWDIASRNTIWVSPHHHATVQSAVFSTDGKRIVSGCHDGTTRVWNFHIGAQTIEEKRTNTEYVMGIAISPNGLRVASGWSDNIIRFWDTRTGDEIGKPLEGHTDSVSCVAFSHDGQRLVSGSADKTLRLWDLETFDQLGEPLVRHTSWVRCVSFSSDSRRVVSGSANGTILIWHTETHELIGELRGNKGWGWVAETSDGCYVVAKNLAKNTTIWNREKREAVWRSDSNSDEMSNESAMEIIRSCGGDTPNLWPRNLQGYSPEICCETKGLALSVYSTALGGKTLLGTLPSTVQDWKYNSRKKKFVAALRNGSLAICNFIRDHE